MYWVWPIKTDAEKVRYTGLSSATECRRVTLSETQNKSNHHTLCGRTSNGGLMYTRYWIFSFSKKLEISLEAEEPLLLKGAIDPLNWSLGTNLWNIYYERTWQSQLYERNAKTASLQCPGTEQWAFISWFASCYQGLRLGSREVSIQPHFATSLCVLPFYWCAPRGKQCQYVGMPSEWGSVTWRSSIPGLDPLPMKDIRSARKMSGLYQFRKHHENRNNQTSIAGMLFRSTYCPRRSSSDAIAFS
jgi:hypothetical protein